MLIALSARSTLLSRRIIKLVAIRNIVSLSIVCGVHELSAAELDGRAAEELVPTTWPPGG